MIVKTDPLGSAVVVTNQDSMRFEAKMENIDEVDETGVYQNYLYFFKSNKFIVS
jgi:hypothetical protein